MPKYRKKLIEIDLPLADINKESAREKSIRHGHPSTLHLWWARRPLASCRAVIFASMVDDPSSCPDEFPTIEDQAIERKRLHDIITRLVKWENSNDPELLAQARLEIAKSIARQPDKPPIPDNHAAPDRHSHVHNRHSRVGGNPQGGDQDKPASPPEDRHTGFKAVSTGAAGDAGEQDKPTTPDDRHTGFKAVSTGAAGDAGEQDKTTTPEDRHTGFKAVSTAQGEQDKTTTPEDRHTGFKAVSTGQGEQDKPTTPDRHSRVGGNPQGGDDTILQYLAKHAPTIYDPFCGGGSIPLEAQRLGMKAVGSDLNPVAVLITKALIEIPPKYANKPPINPDADPMGMTVGKGRKAQKVPWRGAAGLADDIRYYGKWMREEVFKRIGHLYPTIKDENGIERTVIAWLWCRTIPCANPACGIKMPMMKTFQLSKKLKNRHWTKPVVDRETNTISFKVQNHPTDVPDEATVNRNGATCIACKSTVKLDYVRQQAREGKMDEQMTAIVAEGDRKRLFISPTDEHVHTALSAEPKWRPNQTMPDDPTLVSGRGYGVTHWHQLFTERQLLTLTTFSDLISEVRSLIVQDSDGNDEYADAVCTYLAFTVSKIANGGSKFSVWDPSGMSVKITFMRQAVPMTWDFPESNPFSTSGKNYDAHYEGVAKLVEVLPTNATIGKTYQADASTTVHANDGPIIVTDPPYYDNIQYADLSDFFYVWLRPVLRDTYPELFAGILTPKIEEMIAAPRFEDPRQHFEDGLNKTLKLIRQHCTDDYPSSIFYAYKQQEEERGGQTSTGWETMLNALIDSGFHVIGTWPMRTELTTALKTTVNSLASSIVIVCRPRPEDAKSATRQQFLNELADEMPKALDQLTREGHIAPTDLAQSAIGPGMEIYSKYSSVTYISGKPFTVKDALMAINLEIQKYDERETGDLDAESQFCVTWLKQHGFDQGDYGVAETLSKAKNIDVDDLADMHDILTAESGKVQLHDIDYYHPPEHDPELPIDDRGGNMTAWEACFRMAYHLDYGRWDADEVRGAARVFNTKGRYTERIERLARILYNYHDSRREAREAYPFNAVATRWNEIFVEANRLGTSHQETLT